MCRGGASQMEARLHCICAYFFSAIEVMHAYEIMNVPEVTNHAHAAGHGSQKAGMQPDYYYNY